MECPICSGSDLPDDVFEVDKEGTIVILKGKINAIYNPIEHNVPPFSKFYTVTLYQKKGGVKYLKFENKNDLGRNNLKKEDEIQCEGCKHIANGKDIIFDIQNIKIIE